MWTDSHCHVPYEGVGVEVIDAARTAGVTRLITVGTDAAQSAAAVEVAESHAGVWATVGLHPHDAVNGVGTILPLLARRSSKVVAIGECGLDYHYDHSPRAAQREVFAAQVSLALEYDMALVVHTREAWDDTFAILAEQAVPERTVFHCFTGGPGEAERALGLGAASPTVRPWCLWSGPASPLLGASRLSSWSAPAGTARRPSSVCPSDLQPPTGGGPVGCARAAAEPGTRPELRR